MTTEEAALREFAKRMVKDYCWGHEDPDGGSVQDLAEKLGLIVQTIATKEDAADQCEFEPGDTIYKFADWLKDTHTEETLSALPFRYRIADTIDAEERLEDAAMAKAMVDVLSVVLVKDGAAEFGRDKRFSAPRTNIAYWDDPAFIQHAGRPIEITDVDGANASIARLHEAGKGAFVKATDLKLFATAVPVGTSMHSEVGDLIWSVLDRGACIMVQPLCDVRFEMRFVSIERAIATWSSVAVHLTPINRPYPGWLYETPRSTAPIYAPEISAVLTELASEVAREAQFKNVIIDCAIIDGRAAVVEFNPFSVGNFGLYACDPYAIAKALPLTYEERGE